MALISAFYEIAERAPKRLVLTYRGDPDRIEIFRCVREGLKRIEALLNRKN